MIGKLLLGFWILRWISLAGSLAEAVPLDESLDEMNDAEIFRAVLVSMRQWALHKRAHQRAKRELSKVCYEDVGCFEDTGPFSYLEMLPSPPKDVGTRFLVYGSRKARSIPMEVPADDIGDGAHRAIDPDLPTKVIVHGFGSSCDHVWVYEMRSALMAVHDCNIVCVDWGPGSAVPNYVRAAANTRLVGRQLAKLIRSLNVPLEKVHLIGFSLGAHVAGFAGAELGNVSRITGLDPAGPLFESQDPRARLDETDANFVDVIHSNGEQLLLGGLGSWQPMGDVDFYPNGGRMQTGCSNIFVGAVSDIIWSSAVEGRSLCNHRRAYKLFTDSVSPRCRFPAFPCETGFDGLLRGECFPCGGPERPCGDMGYYSDESPARGQLYLVTRDEEPFCAHQFQVKVYNSRGERPTKSYGRLQVTLVGEGLFNDTFSMTRKDEELLVGATLQKIVVPHPAISNLEGIEVRYTAYNGWLSSGLDSWSIDKVSVVDSFGKALSVCRKGLSLVSGRASYLPLYPGECNVPAEAENSTLPVLERLVDQSVGIGPFTREENFKERPMEFKDRSSELKDRVQDFKDQSTEFSDRPVEFGDRSTEFKERLTEFKDRAPEFKDAVTSKGLGPYTKEENLRILESFRSKVNEETRRPSNPWTIQDLSDGESNSLEGGDLETGRGFSNFIPRSEPATEYPSEIREPVLRTVKKEAGSGRSLKLPEITEPILRPRPTRQNGEDSQGQDSGSRTRSFTVQFLPERLAGILAQAERYARQTLLPLISQYTPSFVAGPRLDQPRYFPPLGEVERSEYMEGGGSVVETSGGYRFLEESNRTFESETDDGQPGDGREDYGGHAGHENHGGHGGREGYGGPGGDAGDAGRVSYEGREDHRGLGGSEGHAGHGGREDHEGHGGVENPEGSEDHEASGEPGQDTNTEFSEGAGQAGTPEDAAGPAQFRLNQGQGQGRDQPPLQLPWTPSQLESDWQPISEAPRRDPNGSRSLDFDQPNHANSGSLSDLNLSLERSNSDAISPGGQLNGSRSLDLGKVDLASRSSEAASVDAIAGKDEGATWSKKVQGATEPADESNVGWLENGAVTLDEEDWVPITPETKTAEVETPPSSPDRKYIPLSQPEVSTKPSDTEEPSSTAYSHIQRIPKVIGHQPVTLRRSMMFPYAYERKKDPRTRYIPLIPEEDFGRSPLLLEKER